MAKFVIKFPLVFLLTFTHCTTQSAPEVSSNLKLLKTESGEWKKALVYLEETSGSVAPNYRYSKTIKISADKKGLYFFRKDTKSDAVITNLNLSLTEDSYQKLMLQLLDLGLHNIPFEKEPKNKITGVSYNKISFQLGDLKTEFYYLLENLKQKEFKQKTVIIETLKRITP
ncbi:hypothetical protein P3G55_01345 [Leptospira sp. 96542]|nr:hypothetical protein [Leptospira sp. 96542]